MSPLRWMFHRCIWRPTLTVAMVGFSACLLTAGAWVSSAMGTPAVWLQTPDGWSAAAMVTPRLAVLAFGQADDNTAGMEWRSGLFARLFPHSGYGVDLADQPEGGGSVFTHLGLIATDVEVPVARTGPGFTPFGTSTYTVRAVYLPPWLMILALAVVPGRWTAIAVGARRARARRTGGACPNCGYDMRATPARCPECGAVTPAAAE